jgi:hypothetical protein
MVLPLIFSAHHHFVLLCLKLLSTHLSLALAGGVASTILGEQARPLRNLLFRLMDTNTPQSVQEVGFVLKYSSSAQESIQNLFLWAVKMLAPTSCSFNNKLIVLLFLSHMFGYLEQKLLSRSRKSLVFLKSNFFSSEKVQVSAHVLPK